MALRVGTMVCIGAVEVRGEYGLAMSNATP
jgi:hypothetical protein